MRIGIVGAGMAGLACAEELTGRGHHVRPFDKGRGPGGRMSTRASQHLPAKPISIMERSTSRSATTLFSGRSPPGYPRALPLPGRRLVAMHMLVFPP